MPTISVIVPVYKVEPYLRRCVDSILAQTFTDFELILVDDGSPDGCPAICDEYAKKDDRIVVIHQKNKGVSAARNQGVQMATSEFVTFIDSDDCIHPQMLDILWNGIYTTNAKLALCYYQEVVEYPIQFQQCTTNISAFDITSEYLCSLCNSESGNGAFWFVWGKLIARELVLELPMPEGRIYEDIAVAGAWCHMAGRIAITKYPLYFYTNNPAGQMRMPYNLKKLDMLTSLKECITYWERNKIPSLAQSFRDAYFTSLRYHCHKVYYTLKNKQIAKKLQSELRKWYRHYKKSPALSRKDHLQILECLYPFIMKCYWKIHSFIKNIRR